MAFVLDYETEHSEQISIKTRDNYCNTFLKNYTRFGWELTSKMSSGGLFRINLKRSKHHPNLAELKKLENEFQYLIKDIKVDEYGHLITFGEGKNPDYIDYDVEKPLVEEYKLSTGTIVLNTVCCFFLIGFLMWADTAKKVLIDNKKAKKYNEIQAKVKEIFRKADELI